jgi:hypothetical protein
VRELSYLFCRIQELLIGCFSLLGEKLQTFDCRMVFAQAKTYQTLKRRDQQTIFNVGKYLFSLNLVY